MFQFSVKADSFNKSFLSTLFAIRSNAWDSNFLRILLGMNLRNFGFFLNPNLIDLLAVNEFSGFLRIIKLILIVMISENKPRPFISFSLVSTEIFFSP